MRDSGSLGSGSYVERMAGASRLRPPQGLERRRLPSSRPSIFAFPELELPYPQPQQREADPQGINSPISRGLVCTLQPETCDAREDEAGADNLIDLHAFTIAHISCSGLRAAGAG